MDSETEFPISADYMNIYLGTTSLKVGVQLKRVNIHFSPIKKMSSNTLMRFPAH